MNVRFSGICRNPLSGDGSDSNITRFVAGDAAGGCGSSERLVAAHAGCFQLFVSFQELSGIEHHMGKRQGKCCENNGAQQKDEQGFHCLSPVHKE